MIRPRTIQIVVALILIGTGSQASSGQQLRCFGANESVDRAGGLIIGQATVDIARQPAICRRQMACASAISFVTAPNSEQMHRNVCVKAFPSDPSSHSLGPVRP